MDKRKIGKIERRLGVNLWGKPNSVVNTRRSRPGQQGSKQTRVSDYGLKLKEKQKIKAYYDISEKQLRNLFEEVSKKKGNTSIALIKQLESRLQTVAYRAKWGTMYACRQLVAHGHVLVNEKRVDIRSFRLKEGDVASLSEKAKEMKNINSHIETSPKKTPVYLVMENAHSITFTRSPEVHEVPHEAPLNPQAVVELYAK